MKIIHVITCLLRAGAEENTIATCNAQARRGHRVVLVYGRDVDPASLGMVDGAVKTLQVKSLLREIRPVQDTRALLKLQRVFREEAPDVVHTHNSKAGFLGRWAAHLAGTPIILHGVHILPFLNVSKAREHAFLGMEKMVAPYTDAFIAVSQGMRDANLKAGLGSAETNHIVYSGMNVRRFSEAPPIIPPWGKGRMIAITASLEPRKRHAEFLNVFATLRMRHPDIHLVLLGQGALQEMLETQTQALGLRDYVHFLGFRDDVEQWLAASEVCVLPSMREGLPRSVVQYVAARRPVVVTDLPGIEEIVKDQENGFVVKSGEVADMEGPIGRLLDEPALVHRMSASAAQRDVSRWSEDRMEPQIEQIIQNVAASKGLIVHADTLSSA